MGFAKKLSLHVWSIVLALACLTSSGFAAEPAPPGRVLFIGIDGCRFDSLEKAHAPALKVLMHDGCYSRTTSIIAPRPVDSDTVSGPGWSALLTGVWADKHGVLNNRFAQPRYRQYPHFFHYVKQQWPGAMTVSIADWEPIKQYIVSNADINLAPPEVDPPSKHDLYKAGDAEASAKALFIIRNQDPTAMFVYFGQVDEHGHNFGFHPTVPEYIAAIERVDRYVGDLTAALAARPHYREENWLVLVSSDHGGVGKDHGGGHDKPEIVNSFLIASGPTAARGLIKEQTYLVDVPVTAITHLGVTIKPEWKLDGKPVGLKSK